MKKFFLFILFSTLIYSMNNIDFYLDNDIKFSDGYYTNGIAWKYSYIKNENMWIDDSVSVWTNYVFGQKLYTPSDIFIPPESYTEYDRPYAAWLYFGIEEERAYKNKSRLLYSILVGALGKYAMGEEAQNGVHRFLGLKTAEGWETQIADSIGVQINISYQKEVLNKSFENDISLTGDFKVNYEMGNIFLSSTFSEEFKLGKVREFPYFDSFDEKSYYLFLEPKLSIELYDATTEGDLFKNNSMYTKGIYNFIGKLEGGFRYRYKTVTMAYSLNLNSSEIKTGSWKPLEHIYHKIHINIYF